MTDVPSVAETAKTLRAEARFRPTIWGDARPLLIVAADHLERLEREAAEANERATDVLDAAERGTLPTRSQLIEALDAATKVFTEANARAAAAEVKARNAEAEVERLRAERRPFSDAVADRTIAEQVRTIDRLTKRLAETESALRLAVSGKRIPISSGEPLPECLEDAIAERIRNDEQG